MSQDIENPFKNPLSNKIWRRISQIASTNADNINSDFLSPKELVIPCTAITHLFTKNSYKPKLKEDTDLTNNEVSGHYLFLLMASVHVFLQERAIKTGDKPYLIRENFEEVKAAGKKAILKINDNDLPEAPKEVINKIYDEINKSKTDMTCTIKGHKLDKKYYSIMKEVLAQMGYYFAGEMVIEQNIN